MDKATAERISSATGVADQDSLVNEVDVGTTMIQGSSEIDYHCTATIMFCENKDGKVQVEHCKTHYGHENDVEHLGVTPEAILDNIRSSVDGNLDRLHLITKKDIPNIASPFGIDCEVQKDVVDSVSIDIWVKEMATFESDNVVLLYKPENEASDIFRQEDFVLAIMSKAQAILLSKFGANSVVCMDATHGKNAYDFRLTTLLVKDDHDEGFPVAFLISNREDYTVLKVFLQAVSEKAGIVHSSYFMSDDADQFFSAWNAVNSGTPHKLLCSWHIDRAWRGKILSTVKDSDLRADTYKTLRVILQETDVAQFHILLDNALIKFSANPETVEFSEYFQKNYCDRATTWAYCYRLGAGINTNINLESLHEVLKHIYLKEKVYKRLAKETVHALMKYVPDKEFETFIKLIKVNLTSKERVCNNRHLTALSLPPNLVQCVVDNQWLVQSSVTASVQYCVRKLQGMESHAHTCALACKECRACVHSFTCTCTDFLIKSSLCTHIHLVKIWY